jgi:hypothetical protein
MILAVTGIALGAFGVFRLVTEIPRHSLLILAVWLAAAVIIHDAVLEPSDVGVGCLLPRRLSDPSRLYVQLALIMIAFVAVIATPMIFLRNTQPAETALLLRNYGANLILIIAIIAVLSLILYAVRVARDRSTT